MGHGFVHGLASREAAFLARGATELRLQSDLRCSLLGLVAKAIKQQVQTVRMRRVQVATRAGGGRACRRAAAARPRVARRSCVWSPTNLASISARSKRTSADAPCFSFSNLPAQQRPHSRGAALTVLLYLQGHHEAAMCSGILMGA